MKNRFIRSSLYRVLRFFFKNEKVSTPLDASLIKKILILRYDRMGDMVVTLPMIDIIQKSIPHAEIHVLASPMNIGMISDDPRVAKTILWDRKNSSLFSLSKKIRAENYDVILAVVFFKMTYAGLITNIMAGAKPVKITLAYSESRRAALARD